MDDLLKIQATAFPRQLLIHEIKPHVTLPSVHISHVLGRLAPLPGIHEKLCRRHEITVRHLFGPIMAESLSQQAEFAHKGLMGPVPTEAAARTEEIRHLRRWGMVLAGGVALALWVLFA